ncbi:hypothetical protein VCRA2120O333_70181 [Vibrio crassostreae]|nr:hypothetical protein VCRA2122O341_180015 [Vibrio crassostreae]CAK3579065.1 hypothetical protein VCRA2121O334_70061 [Vibrio crassostreae]CAK3972740.1 hypothetical protein VCRA2120O333_70181 [Vibrio crassostreae]
MTQQEILVGIGLLEIGSELKLKTSRKILKIARTAGNPKGL